MRTTAAVTEERGAPFTIQDVDVDDPRSGEVRVELVACGVCHTDAIARDGDLPFPFPGVLGHEGVGRVEAVGDGVTSVAVGDPVLLGWPWCGRCRNCLAGQPRFCLQLGPLRGRRWPGGRQHGARAAVGRAAAQPLLRAVVLRPARGDRRAVAAAAADVGAAGGRGRARLRHRHRGRRRPQHAAPAGREQSRGLRGRCGRARGDHGCAAHSGHRRHRGRAERRAPRPRGEVRGHRGDRPAGRGRRRRHRARGLRGPGGRRAGLHRDRCRSSGRPSTASACWARRS